jgi:aminoglycoside phosphotransferase (APT) family kinase protein
MAPPSPVPVHGFDVTPEDRLLLRGPLPAAARRWVLGELGPGSRIVSAYARAGGTSSAVHGLTVDDARGVRHRLVLRRYVRSDWLEREPDLAEHEARVLTLLEPSAVEAPRLVAVDPNGGHCDVPAVLMTRLPGRVRWSPRDVRGFIERIVDPMLVIHAVRVPDSVPIRTFRRYYEDEVLQPPAGSSCPEAWARAIEVHAGPPPAVERVFIHRDYHPGNLLWAGDSVSGVVDWVNASLGSPEADVGHCRINLARHLGYEAAELLAQRYRARSGRGDYHPYWDLVAAVGMLDDAVPARGWLHALDEFVERAVARLRATR